VEEIAKEGKYRRKRGRKRKKVEGIGGRSREEKKAESSPTFLLQ